MFINGYDVTQFMLGLAAGVVWSYIIIQFAHWCVDHRERRSKGSRVK